MVGALEVHAQVMVDLAGEVDEAHKGLPAVTRSNPCREAGGWTSRSCLVWPGMPASDPFAMPKYPQPLKLSLRLWLRLGEIDEEPHDKRVGRGSGEHGVVVYRETDATTPHR